MSRQPEPRWLAPGQPEWLWMTRDAHVMVQEGGARLSLPTGGAGLAPHVTVTLSAGSAYRVERAGWARWQALGGRPAMVLCIADAPPPSRSLVALLRAGARRLHLGPLAGLGGDRAGERC